MGEEDPWKIAHMDKADMAEGLDVAGSPGTGSTGSMVDMGTLWKMKCQKC